MVDGYGDASGRIEPCRRYGGDQWDADGRGDEQLYGAGDGCQWRGSDEGAVHRDLWGPFRDDGIPAGRDGGVLLQPDPICRWGEDAVCLEHFCRDASCRPGPEWRYRGDQRDADSRRDEQLYGSGDGCQWGDSNAGVIGHDLRHSDTDYECASGWH